MAVNTNQTIGCSSGNPHIWKLDREFKPAKKKHKHQIWKCVNANCGAEKEGACVICDSLANDGFTATGNFRFKRQPGRSINS